MNKEVEKINLVMVGVVIVLFLRFLALLFSLIAFMFQSWQNRTPSYEDLIQQVSNQNIKIDTLVQEYGKK